MLVFFVKNNENTYPKALMQMYRVVPITKKGNSKLMNTFPGAQSMVCDNLTSDPCWQCLWCTGAPALPNWQPLTVYNSRSVRIVVLYCYVPSYLQTDKERWCLEWVSINALKLSIYIHIILKLVWFWGYLTMELIWHKWQSTLRPSICLSLIVKSHSIPFLEPANTKQWG